MVKKKLTKSAQVRALLNIGKTTEYIVKKVGCTKTLVRQINGKQINREIDEWKSKEVVDNFPKVGDNVGGLVLTDMGNGKLKWIRQAPASIPIPNYLKPDMVNNPPHYKRNGIEVVDVIEAFELNYRLGNVVKYVLRHVGKDGVEDLKKAQWYLSREISKHE